MSRKIIAMLCALALCMSTLGTALAQPEPYNAPRCKPEEVDLTDVHEENGRLTGVLRLPEGSFPEGEVRVDCPIPEAFPTAQAQTLHVAYKPIGKRALATAMKAVGQSTKAGKLECWSNANQFSVSYSLWDGNTEPMSYAPDRLRDASFFDDPSYADSYSQAKGFIRALLAQLGASAYEPLLHANRYDAEHAVSADSFACYSHGEALYQTVLESFRHNAKRYAYTENGLTMVSGLYELYGLPVMYEYSWQSGQDRFGAGSDFHAIVSDDGQVRLFSMCGLPTVKSIEPLTLPAYSWQELLARVACGWWLGNPRTEDATNVSDFGGEAYTIYATYSVITEIRPCWIGYERDILVPGYYMNVEERTVRDDKLIAVWPSYGDAATLTLTH